MRLAELQGKFAEKRVREEAAAARLSIRSGRRPASASSRSHTSSAWRTSADILVISPPSRHCHFTQQAEALSDASTPDKDATTATDTSLSHTSRGSAASGGALAPEPPHATRNQPESIR